MTISAVSAVSGPGSATAASPVYSIVNTVIRETVYPDGSVSSTTDKTVTTSAQNTGNTLETVVTYATSGSARGAGPFTTPVTPTSNAVGASAPQVTFSPTLVEQLDGTLSTFSVFV